MRVVVQRVSWAKVIAESKVLGQIQQGLVIFVGIARDDEVQDGLYLADKLINLRIFSDRKGKMNLSIRDIEGSLLVVSQFTLLGDCRKGRRPGFEQAADPLKANAIYQDFISRLEAYNLPVAQGKFQADMKVELANDGPVTILLDSKKLF
ncbi:MAG: D-tyrosyl-tRNA(Tyr) deacylase [Syntrophomonadaceae bacterium]|nr:D-tyrosyl-tRNA(Tyr) deacylase [Syntrophomonadaceae bacterium]